MKISLYSIKNIPSADFGVPFPAISEADAIDQVKNAFKSLPGNIDRGAFNLVLAQIYDTSANKMYPVNHLVGCVEDLLDSDEGKESEVDVSVQKENE